MARTVEPRLNGTANGRPAHDAATGRFVPGGPGGPGRPRKDVEREYLAELRRLVPLRRFAKVVRKALQQAEAGDPVARTWLSKHLIGDDPLGLIELLDRVSELEASR